MARRAIAIGPDDGPLSRREGHAPDHSSRLVVTTPGFVYAFKGIWFFATHRYLWPLLKARLLPAALLSAGVLSILFVFTYLPQAAFMALFHGRRGALVNAAFLVLGEGAAITALLFEAFFVDHAQVDVFDSVLLEDGGQDGYDLVSGVRTVYESSSQDTLANDSAPLSPRQCLGPHHQKGQRIFSPFSLRQIIEFIFFLPLNFIPWLGVPLFLYLTGYRAGPLLMHRYLMLKGLRGSDKRRFVKNRRIGLTGLGLAALVLQLVPILSMVFLLTTACGVAVWACEIEHEERQLIGIDESADAHASHGDDHQGGQGYGDADVEPSAAQSGLGRYEQGLAPSGVDYAHDNDEPPPPYADAFAGDDDEERRTRPQVDNYSYADNPV